MISGQTKGYKSTEFWLTIILFSLGVIMILTELGLMLFVGTSLGLDLNSIFGWLAGGSAAYSGVRGWVKHKTISGINNKQKIDADLQKSSNNQYNIPETYEPAYTPQDLEEDTTRIPPYDA